MTRALKTLFLVLALAALPLRGMAAVAMWHCAQGQHDAVSVSADRHAGHEHAHGDSQDHAGHHAQASNDASVETTSSSGDALLTSTCSACAACCMGGTVAPTAWTLFTFAPIGASRIAFVEPHFTGIVPAQLERPPHVQSL